MSAMVRLLFRLMVLLACGAVLPTVAIAAPCPGNPSALSTERVLTVDAAASPRVGRKQFPATLPLADKEVVLTFDDGPWPGTTGRILDTLARDCVRATFFALGRNAAAHPQLVRRALAEGHTVASHTFSHPRLDRMPADRAEAEVNHGIAAVDTALHGEDELTPSTPFFRFPGFVATPALLDRLKARGIVVFGADLWASDWHRMSPDRELHLLLNRLAATGRGIILLHDTKSQTAAMLPTLLQELKRRRYRVVHVVPTTKSTIASGH
jgi:peptidoglycan/xylan/chitin deacetylase (PgdA/CDA1 family)